MKVINRVLNYFDYKGIKPTRAEKDFGFSNGYFGTQLKRNADLGESIINKIIDNCLDLNPEWLLTGKGEMIKTVVNETSDIPNIFNVRLVGQYAYAGYLGGYGDAEYMETLPTVPFLVPDGQTTRGQYMAFEVRGDSMDDESKDSILAGDLALGRLIKPDLYTDSKLHYKKWGSFVLVTKSDGIIIKQIIDHDIEKKTITIHSLNPMYEDKILHLKDIAQIFNVVQLLRKTTK